MTPNVDNGEAQSAVVDQWRALASVIDRLMFLITFLISTAGFLSIVVIIATQPVLDKT